MKNIEQKTFCLKAFEFVKNYKAKIKSFSNNRLSIELTKKYLEKYLEKAKKPKENLALKAFELIKKYQAEIKRRDGNRLIYTHPIQVAGIKVITNPFDPMLNENTAISILHDTLEDVPEITYEMLCLKFGKYVADGVKNLTDVKCKTKEETLLLSKSRLFLSNKNVQIIKMADIVSNTHSIEDLEPERAPKYLQEKADQVNILTKVSKDLLSVFLPTALKKYL